MLIGYARVSTEQQSLDRQLDSLLQYGCEVIYQEKVSGVKGVRPEFKAMLKYARAGDIIVVDDLSRLSRSMMELLKNIAMFESLGINFKSIKNNIIDTTTAQGKLLFHIMSALSEFERNTIIERTRDGLKAARERGRVGGRKRKSAETINQAIKMYNGRQFTVSEICKACDISNKTLYNYLNPKKTP